MHYLLRVCSLLAIVFLFQLATSTYGFISDDESAKSTAANATENRRNSETNPSSRLIMNDVDFDVEFAEKYVDYNLLSGDNLVAPVFNTEALALLNDGKFDDAIAKLQQKIKNYLAFRTAWGTVSPKVKSQGKPAALQEDELIPLSRYVHLLGLAFELKKDYYNATNAYRLVFDSNPKDWEWTEARLRYERGRSDPWEADQSFCMVCNIIRRYNLSAKVIDEAIEYAKEEETRWKSNPPEGYEPIFLLHHAQGNQVLDALELYKIRLWCARFVCPNLLYKYRIRDGQFTSDGRAETVRLIRDSYDSFMIFMEEEYAKAMEDGHENVLSMELRDRSEGEKESFTIVMAILRKIKELPY